VSVLLLIGAGLLIRSVRNLQHVDVGFNTQNLLLFSVEPGLQGYREARLVELYQKLFSRLEAVPGVQSVTASRVPLLSFAASTSSVFFPGAALNSDGTPTSAGDTKLLTVREKLPGHHADSLVGWAITWCSRRCACAEGRGCKSDVCSEVFPNDNVIGKRFSLDPTKPGEIEIVGLAKDAKYTSQRDQIEPTAYTPWQQSLRSMRGSTIELRTHGDPANYVTAVREAVREVDSNLPVNDVQTQVDQANETLAMERLFAKLLSLFGVLAQLLAAVGLYGLMAYSVSQRTHEIGVRMALGATRGTVMKMVLQQGMLLTVIGVVVGLGGAYALTGYLESLTTMLFGVEPRDPMTFVVIAVVLGLIALVACLVPARRATKVDPLVALRYE
jgi:hypothetical protein